MEESSIMKNMKSFLNALPNNKEAEAYGVYPKSIFSSNQLWVMMAADEDCDYLIASGEGQEAFKGEDLGYIKAPLTHENAHVLRELFPFTKARKVLHEKRSFGLGDRLGIAGDGHLRVFDCYDAYPILAQQSIRELNLTQRTYEDVMDAATFAVFRHGFTRGFGADGDHLKTRQDIEYALGLGFTMLTLDCSDYIRNDILGLSHDQLKEDVELSDLHKDRYMKSSFDVEGSTIEFDEAELMRCELIYGKAIQYTIEIYNDYIKDRDAANFELSIDETATPTTPTQHFFVANELYEAGVKLDTMAPRFVGEFQKGVDYIGDLVAFEKDLDIHAKIARHFGYKLSIHSGSDKFSIFTLVGKYTRGNFHVKTAGTNWLEAMRVVAMKDPQLYREIHAYALSMFDTASQFYHVTTNIHRIPDLSSLSDEALPSLFTDNDARQLIHITYGYILNDKQPDGTYRFKDKLYKLWREERDTYAKALEKHIGRHLELLYQGF